MAAGLASAGCRVMLVNRNADEGMVAAAELSRDFGTEAISFAADITDEAQTKAMAQAAMDAFGQIDILINSAGINIRGAIDELTSDDFRKVMDVNVNGTWLCCRAVTPFMKQAGSGKIINLASTLGLVGLANRTPYTASKGAVLAMTYSIAKDFLPHGIRCNALLPGRIHTPLVDAFIAKNYAGHEAEMFEKLSKEQPIGRMGTPEEVAAAAHFLCSDEAGFITGSGYPVDGGVLTLR
jgi:gluconate 5-dehydrogenase